MEKDQKSSKNEKNFGRNARERVTETRKPVDENKNVDEKTNLNSTFYDGRILNPQAFTSL